MNNIHTVRYYEDICGDIHEVTDAEWSDGPDPRTGCAYLVVLGTEPAQCHFSEHAAKEASERKFGECYDPSIPF